MLFKAFGNFNRNSTKCSWSADWKDVKLFEKNKSFHIFKKKKLYIFLIKMYLCIKSWFKYNFFSIIFLPNKWEFVTSLFSCGQRCSTKCLDLRKDLWSYETAIDVITLHKSRKLQDTGVIFVSSSSGVWRYYI